eukprot:72509_2
MVTTGPPKPCSYPPTSLPALMGRLWLSPAWESDIVTLNADGSHTSIPCTEHYNHHFSGSMSGKAASHVELARELEGSAGYLPRLMA